MARSPTSTSPMVSSWPSSELRLASLNPSAPSAFVNAVVTLMWPFSPSSSTLSIVASEEDFRLRLSKGQLRVNFNDACANAVGARGLQIGDQVMISLEGAVFEELSNATSRDVPWSITFTSRLTMKIKTASGWSTIDVDAPTGLPVLEPTPPVVENPSSSARPSTPPLITPFSYSQNENEWTTPGLFKRRLGWSDDEPSSSTFAIGTRGLFDEEDDLDLGHRTKRPRFSSSYRLLDGNESPQTDVREKEERGGGGCGVMTLDGNNDREFEEEGAAEGGVDAAGNSTIEQEMVVNLPENLQMATHPSHIVMPPPPLPPLTTQFDTGGGVLDNTPNSPSLRPVPSEQLPIISPFLNRGLAGTDYMGAILDSSLRAHEAGIITNTISPVASPGQVHQEVAVISQEGGPAADEPLDELSAAPEVFIVPADEEITVVTTTVGPSIVQKIADQRRGSLSEDDRQPSDYESEKDSLFDEFSDNEMRKRVVKSRNLGRSPLKSFESLTPRRSVPYSKPSRLILETTSTEKSPSAQPKTPFLYLPTPSPKIEKRNMHFPTSAPPKFMTGPYNSELDREGTSPIRRKSNFWGATKEPVPNEISAYFGRPKKGLDITPATAVSPIGEGDNGTGTSNTEAEISSFSTPKTNEVGDDDGEGEDEDEDEEQELDFGFVFKAGVTTNLSDFPALSSLTWGVVVDIIGVVSRFRPTQRAKGGQQDYYMSMRVVDSSLPIGITATVLRPHKDALPIVDVGDVVLLRSFKISSQKRKNVATSTTNSAWAVWKDYGRSRPVRIAGPPVEYGEQEERYVEDIGAWYARLDRTTREEIEKEMEEDAALDGVILSHDV